MGPLLAWRSVAECMQQNQQPLNSLCIVRLSAIGDVCHAVTTVQAIQRRLPDTKISWVVGRVEHALISDLPGIEFIVFDKQRGMKAYLELRKRFSKEVSFDVLLQMQTSLRANLVGGMIKARRKIGFPYSRAKELHSLFVTEHLPETNAFHVLDMFQHFAGGIGISDCETAWNIPLPAYAVTQAEKWLGKNAHYVLICPSASNTERNWLPDRYADIARHCHARGLEVVLTGSPAEREIALAADIENKAGIPMSNLAGQTDLKELLALCRGARVVIGPDSGTLHMATTQGTPVVGLYAHSSPRRTGPYRDLHRVADAYTKALETGSADDKLPRWGYRLKGPSRMARISVDEVIQLIDGVLRDSSEPT